MASTASRMALAPIRPYRDFLTPSLHRRFTSAALLCLVVCYVEAILLGRWDLFWIWFPIGPTGLRTFVLFLSILAVYILRIGQLHIGARTSFSPFNTSYEYISTSIPIVVQTLLWYTFSAWLFGETYIWSASAGAKLSVVNNGNHQQRAHLNERPIYLRTVFLCLGMTQAFFHLYNDYDRVVFEAVKPVGAAELKPIDTAQSKSIDTTGSKFFEAVESKLPKLILRFIIATRGTRKKYFASAVSIPIRTAVSVVAATILYAGLLRHTVWVWTYSVAKHFYSLPKTSTLSTIPPSPMGLFLHALASAILLIFLWEFANQAFGIFVGQQPLKKGVPLSERAGPDNANPTLVAGLKSKKETFKSFAFWELLIIAQMSPPRRERIYRDYPGTRGISTWSEMVTVCLGQANAVIARIQASQTPDPGAKQQAPQEVTKQSSETGPKLKPLKEGPLTLTAPAPKTRYAAIENSVGSLAKTIGEHPGATNPISPRARKLLSYTKEKLVPEQATPAGLKQRLDTFIIKFLRSPLGYPFRQTFARRATAIILGTPYSQLSPLIDSIAALAKLAVCSIAEDTYGHVATDVPNIIRTFTSTCDKVETFVQGLPPHWTDVYFDGEGGRKVEEVEVLLKALRDALRMLVNQFGEYADTLGMREEVRMAKEVVARGAKEQADS